MDHITGLACLSVCLSYLYGLITRKKRRITTNGVNVFQNCNPVPEMTYTVSGGTLTPTLSPPLSPFLSFRTVTSVPVFGSKDKKVRVMVSRLRSFSRTAAQYVGTGASYT